MAAQRAALDKNRWHFNHCPIDIVAEAHGDPYAVAAAHDAAWARFGHVLDELVRELPLLRLPVTDGVRPRGVVARRMWDACGRARCGWTRPRERMLCSMGFRRSSRVISRAATRGCGSSARTKTR